MNHVVKIATERDEFHQLEDGYFYWFPSNGALSATDLRAVAEHLDRVNAEWDEQVRRGI